MSAVTGSGSGFLQRGQLDMVFILPSGLFHSEWQFGQVTDMLTLLDSLFYGSAARTPRLMRRTNLVFTPFTSSCPEVVTEESFYKSSQDFKSKSWLSSA
jgi:hypothetical protein